MKAEQLLLVSFLVAVVPMASAPVWAAMLEAGTSASISFPPGSPRSSYTVFFDNGTNYSFEALEYNVTGVSVKASVSVWEDAGYTRLKGSIPEFTLDTAKNSVSLMLPHGRYANITISSASAWTLNKAGFRTSTKPSISGVAVRNSTDGEPASFGREIIKVVVTALSPGGSSNMNVARVTIKSPDQTLVNNQVISSGREIEGGMVYEYPYAISGGKAGNWTVNITVSDDQSQTAGMELNFTVRVAPNVTVSLSPVAAYDNNDLNCTVRPYSEVASGPVSCYVSWLKGQSMVNQSPLYKKLIVANGSSMNTTLTENYTAVGDVWKCSIVAYDGSETSAGILSDMRVILAVGQNCTDTDGGVANETVGTAGGKLENGQEASGTDFCDTSSGTKILREYYCKDVGNGDKRVSYQVITCPYACSGGRCITDYDADNDGFTESQGDCNNNNAAIHPDAKEVCSDGIDNDCDGKADDQDAGGCTCKNGDTKVCGNNIGACLPGQRTCLNGAFGDCTGGVGPKTEICGNNVDDDCDGLTDLKDTADCDCLDGQTKVCGSNVGECAQGQQSCASGRWGACSGNKPPSQEVCDGKDNDCDTDIDNGCVNQSDIEAMCRNGRMDTYEGGVDCGGVCANACPNATGNATASGGEGSGVELWMAVAALGLLIMGGTGVFIVFSKKAPMD